MAKLKGLFEIANGMHITKRGIARLFEINYERSCTIFDKAQEIEIKELGSNYFDKRRVRTKTVLKLLGLTKEDVLYAISAREARKESEYEEDV